MVTLFQTAQYRRGGGEGTHSVKWRDLANASSARWARAPSTALHRVHHMYPAAVAAAKSLWSCPALCNPIDGSPPGSPVPGILQARTLEWVAISFSNAWKWKVKVKSLSCVRLSVTPWTGAYQAPPSMGFSRQEYWSGVPLTPANSWEKHQTHHSWGTFNRTPGQYSSKSSRIPKTRKVWKTVTAKRRLRRHENEIQCSGSENKKGHQMKMKEM